MRFINNHGSEITIDFCSLNEENEFPTLTHTFVLLLEDEVDINLEEISTANSIVFFRTNDGITIRLLEEGASVFIDDENDEDHLSSAIEIINTLLPGYKYEEIKNDLKIKTTWYLNPPRCLIS